MKITDIDHGDWTERRFEPDDPPAGDGKANGGAAPAAAKVEAKADVVVWPVLGSAAYHGLAGKVVNTILPHTEADPAAMLLQYLVSFGNVVGRQPYCVTDGAEHYPVLYLLLAGPTAAGRKGTSAQRIRAVFDIAAPDWTENNIASGLSSGEGIIHAIRDPVFGLNKNTGALVLHDAGVTDKRMLFDEREFASVLDRMRREGNTLETVIRDAWDCRRRLETKTKHSPTKATNPHVSITAHITIEEVRQKLNQTSMANGFANRFLYGCARRSKLLPRGGMLAKDDMDLLGAATSEAVTSAGAITLVDMAPEAAELWDSVYPKLVAEVPGLIGAILSRGATQTMRLALVYALLDRAPQIARVHLEAALAVWDYSEASARYIFGDTIGDPLADTIFRFLRGASPTGMDRTDISNRLGRNESAAKIDAALGKLLVAGKVRYEIKKPATGIGRHRELWFAT
jgi:hypothetical protein